MRKSTSLDALTSIAGRGTPFTDRSGQACIYVRAWNSSGFEYFPIRSPRFRQWIYSEYHSEHDNIPTSHAFRTLLLHLEAQATNDPRNQRLTIFHRVGTRAPGFFPNEILLDLANPRREFVEIGPTGWKTTTGHAFFRTSRSTDPLRAPDPHREATDSLPANLANEASHPTDPASEAPGSPPPSPNYPGGTGGSACQPAESQPPAPAPGPANESRPIPAGAASDPGPCRPAPNPAFEASLSTLRSLLNLASRADWLRCLAWLLSTLRPYGPFPPLIFQSPPSSGKTWAARVLRFLVDPSSAPLTPIPSSTRELLTLAQNNWILAFDHISTFSPNLTDALTRLSTNAGMSVRETGTPTSDPILKSVSRPMLLTVTDRFQCPASLAERALTVSFAPLPPDRRRSEAELGAALTGAGPAILAALCNAVSTALRRIPETSLPTGRAPDALAWALAAAPALGCTEDEMRQAFHDPPPPDPTVEAIRALVDQHGTCTGSATDFLDLLPPSPHYTTGRGVSQHLKKHTFSVADQGIDLEFAHKTANSRTISVRYALACPPVGQAILPAAGFQPAPAALSNSTPIVDDAPQLAPLLPAAPPADCSAPVPRTFLPVLPFLPGASQSVPPAPAAPPQDASQNPENPSQPTQTTHLPIHTEDPLPPVPEIADAWFAAVRPPTPQLTLADRPAESRQDHNATNHTPAPGVLQPTSAAGERLDFTPGGCLPFSPTTSETQ